MPAGDPPVVEATEWCRMGPILHHSVAMGVGEADADRVSRGVVRNSVRLKVKMQKNS